MKIIIDLYIFTIRRPFVPVQRCKNEKKRNTKKGGSNDVLEWERKKERRKAHEWDLISVMQFWGPKMVPRSTREKENQRNPVRGTLFLSYFVVAFSNSNWLLKSCLLVVLHLPFVVFFYILHSSPLLPPSSPPFPLLLSLFTFFLLHLFARAHTYKNTHTFSY